MGLYWFASFDQYRRCYRDHFDAAGSSNGERYIAPMYNTLIRGGEHVSMSLLPKSAVHPLGTPEELEAFGR